MIVLIEILILKPNSFRNFSPSKKKHRRGCQKVSIDWCIRCISKIGVHSLQDQLNCAVYPGSVFWQEKCKWVAFTECWIQWGKRCKCNVWSPTLRILTFFLSCYLLWTPVRVNSRVSVNVKISKIQTLESCMKARTSNNSMAFSHSTVWIIDISSQNPSPSVFSVLN